MFELKFFCACDAQCVLTHDLSPADIPTPECAGANFFGDRLRWPPVVRGPAVSVLLPLPSGKGCRDRGCRSHLFFLVSRYCRVQKGSFFLSTLRWSYADDILIIIIIYCRQSAFIYILYCVRVRFSDITRRTLITRARIFLCV